LANHYQTLGLTHEASSDEIRDAYRSLAKKYHPDVSELPDSEDLFIEVTEAYEILSDPTKRRRYDLTRHSPSPRMAGARKQKVYESYVEKQQESARKKAKEYSKVKYQKFDHEYFDSVAGFYFPKFLGCAAIAILMLLACALILFLTVLIFGNSAITVLMVFILLMVLVAGTAYFSTMFDVWHNARQKQRVRSRTRKRSS
jgi:curved DNA-binding protein CbpA